MPRKQSGGTLLPWLSARADGKEGRFLQTGNSFYLSKKVQNLSNGAFRLYLYMANESGGKREFKFPRATAAKYGVPETSAARQIDELISKGFIERVSSGRTTRTPNLYRFSLSWKGVEPRT